jgi:hypothetical protein
MDENQRLTHCCLHLEWNAMLGNVVFSPSGLLINLFAARQMKIDLIHPWKLKLESLFVAQSLEINAWKQKSDSLFAVQTLETNG